LTGDHAIDTERRPLLSSRHVSEDCSTDFDPNLQRLVGRISTKQQSLREWRRARMSEQNESSVLFNLRELMSLEEERINTEEADAKAVAEAEARRKAEEEARRKAEEEFRLKQERDAQLAEERRIRDEEERRIREREEAALRVRLESEQRARLEEQTRQLGHEEKLKQIEAQRRKGLHPAVLAAAIVLLIGAGAGVYFGVIVPQQQKAEQARIAAQKLAEETASAKQRAEDEKRRLASELEAKGAEADDIRREAEAAKEALAAKSAPRPDSGGGSRGGRPRPAKTAATGSAGARPSGGSNDPLAGLDDL